MNVSTFNTPRSVKGMSRFHMSSWNLRFASVHKPALLGCCGIENSNSQGFGCRCADFIWRQLSRGPRHQRVIEACTGQGFSALYGGVHYSGVPQTH